MRIANEKNIATDKNKAGGYPIPKKCATLSAICGQIDTNKMTALTTSHKMECSIFMLRFRIKFSTNRNSDRLRMIIMIFALRGMFYFQ